MQEFRRSVYCGQITEMFLDKEVLLYAKLRKLKFEKIKERKNKIGKFIDRLEEKHPEVKRAIVNGCLGLG